MLAGARNADCPDKYLTDLKQFIYDVVGKLQVTFSSDPAKILRLEIRFQPYHIQLG